MKHTFTSDDVRRHFNGKKRPPLRTITELACEFGITRNALARYLQIYPNAPKPELKHTTRGAKNTWYKPSEMRVWWKNITPDIHQKDKTNET